MWAEISPGGDDAPPATNSSTTSCGDLVVGVADDGVFLGGEVVEEGPAGDLGPFADLLHRVAVQAALGSEGTRDGGDGRPRGGALALAEAAVNFCTIIHKVKFCTHASR